MPVCTSHVVLQRLVKSLVDVADNLERAAGSVPVDEIDGTKEVDGDRALQLLKSLRDGVLMTDDILMKVCDCGVVGGKGPCALQSSVAGMLVYYCARRVLPVAEGGEGGLIGCVFPT
jgi:hypothetical protein